MLKGDIKFLRSLRAFDVEANPPIYIDSPRGYHTKAAVPPKALQIFFRTMTNVTQGGSLVHLCLRTAPLGDLKYTFNMVKALSTPENNYLILFAQFLPNLVTANCFSKININMQWITLLLTPI